LKAFYLADFNAKEDSIDDSQGFTTQVKTRKSNKEIEKGVIISFVSVLKNR
jgi:hypothetical protein